MRQHVDGVNALQSVAWTINTAMIPVVDRLAGVIGKKVSKLLVAHDVATANMLGGAKFYVPMNCDFRGRVYGIPHFNFQREDHVRALFQFAQGMQIGEDGLDWLMIHVANCGNFGAVRKRPWDERIAWTQSQRSMIEQTASDPLATVDWWRDADEPFSFVAGCIELAAAWEAGPNYLTRLPVCFDGSCSGVQHLAMMMRDEGTARLVNLSASEEPQDIYQHITDYVIAQLKADGGEHADWWLWAGIDRKLVKRPAMTFGYSVTVYGMKEQLVEVYREQNDGAEPTKAAAWYLAKCIMTAAEKVMRRPAEAMKFIRKLAEEAADKGKPLEWTSPTGFPWSNLYCKPNVKTIHLELRGEYVRHNIGIGFEPGIVKRDAMAAAAPNFVHALDASHLIRVVNAACNVGVTNIAVVHDSFGCLAPQARKLLRTIRTQLAELYSQDVLADLRDAAGSSEPLPTKGSLDMRLSLFSEYAFT